MAFVSMMKNRFLILIIYFVFTGFNRIEAQDFMLDFVEENYKETKARFSYHPLIYHSIHVNTLAGPKILVLQGKNTPYRNWLRQYIAADRRLILKVDEDRTDQFISAKVFKTDVSNLHPMADNLWQSETVSDTGLRVTGAGDFFLIVETDDKRAGLLTTVSKKMGYLTLFQRNGQAAIQSLKLQPEKFKMIVVAAKTPDMDTAALVEKLVSIKHNIPILVESGYQNSSRKLQLRSKLGAFNSVHIQPVVLSDFQGTIKKLVKKNAQKS